LRAADPKILYAWYEEHLGVSSPYGSFLFPKEAQRAYIAVAFFPQIIRLFPAVQAGHVVLGGYFFNANALA
jgi:hypothetical protein